MRKGRDGGKREKKTGKKKENTDENSGQQSTARTPTAGTPHARANFSNSLSNLHDTTHF